MLFSTNLIVFLIVSSSLILVAELLLILIAICWPSTLNRFQNFISGNTNSYLPVVTITRTSSATQVETFEFDTSSSNDTEEDNLINEHVTDSFVPIFVEVL